MTVIVTEPLQDLQSTPDNRSIAIDKVGIRNLEMPIRVQDQNQIIRETVGTFDAYVNLRHEVKGTHMSRFVEVLHRHSTPYSVETLRDILERMKERLESDAAFLDIRFPYFVEKSAPISGQPSYMNYQVKLAASLEADQFSLKTQLEVPVKTLCPCSKTISKYGAHNQRGMVTVQIETQKTVWLEEIIATVENSASSQLYALLKRPDEKHVTERAYENPVFVEDLVRNIVSHLREDARIIWYQVEAENHESIHNHNAYALVRHQANSESRQ